MIISDVEDEGKEVDDNILLDNQFKLELAGAAGLTAPIAKGVYQRSRYSTPPLLESPLEFDQELKTLKSTIRQITHPKGKKAKRISEAGREVLRNSRIRINQINEAIETARAGTEGKGVFRSAFGLEKGVLGKGLWALGAPAIQLPATLGYIAQDVREVIPEVVRPILSERPTGLPKWEFPRTCPSCGFELDRPSNGSSVQSLRAFVP